MSEIPNDADVRRIFERLNTVTAGEPFANAAGALQDLLCALICFSFPNIDEALEFSRKQHADIEATIRKNWDWYHSQRGYHHDVPAGIA